MRKSPTPVRAMKLEIRYEHGSKSDQKALACICLAISDSESIHVQSCTTSAEAWKKLGDIYEKERTRAKGLPAAKVL